jgi:heme exporter protein A
MSLLEVNDLAVTRGRRTLFSGASFALDPGTLLTILGVNGSGKTTLLRTVAGLSQPAAGTINWRGARADLLYVGHAPALKDELTPEENLRFALELAGTPVANAAVRAALGNAGLAAARNLAAKRLSAGQKRRVHLARLLLSPQRLWLLDEPATALDTDGLSLLTSTLADHLARGGLAVIATHQDLAVMAPKNVQMRLQ